MVILMINKFVEYLKSEKLSENTIKSYIIHINQYYKWFYKNFGYEVNKLFKENIFDFKLYLLNTKKINGRSINAKLSALHKYNLFLVNQKIQSEIVIEKKDLIKIQEKYASPTNISLKEVNLFRQKILENESKRNYAIVTLLIYSGLRISEALNIKLNEINLTSKEIIVKYGKGQKQRIVIINDKIVNSVKEYLNERKQLSHYKSEYLFISRESDKINKSTINKMFKKYSNKITPHSLRHYFCSLALSKGWSVHEVASQAGHSNIHTTLLYTNPSIEDMKKKANLL